MPELEKGLTCCTKPFSCIKATDGWRGSIKSIGPGCRFVLATFVGVAVAVMLFAATAAVVPIPDAFGSSSLN